MSIFQKIGKIFSGKQEEQFYSDNYNQYRQLQNKRGYQIYFPSQLIREHARDESGRMQGVTTDVPYFTLTPEQRVRITQACSPLFGIVSSRMQRISARKITVVSDKEMEDKIVDNMRDVYNIIKEFENAKEMKYLVASLRLKQFLTTKLYDLLPDLSNFESSLLRWSKQNKSQSKQQADSIKSWLENPNQSDNWIDFVKQWVFDLMVHGSSSIYKSVENGKVENLYHLAGGTIFPLRSEKITSATGYVQVIAMEEPQLFYKNELVHSRYLPISSRAYGLVPLEALVNKIAETLLFDKLMADQADGTKIPEKMVIVTEQSPFGGKLDDSFRMPIGEDRQKRLEKKINTPIKGGLMTFSGNTATVVDLSRENTMGIQMQRQKDIREELALVYNMSNMEINLTGSGDTSGRATSESQAEIEQGKGNLPIMANMEYKINNEIIPFRYGYGYTAEFYTEENEKDELEKFRLKLATGLYSINEIRTKDLNENPFLGAEYDLPPGTGQQQADGSTVNPFNMRSVE